MSWTRIESSMPRHPKVLPLSVHAKWAFVEALCWSVELHSDGRIPAEVPFKTFAPVKTAAVLAELLASGLLEQNGTGMVIHDFADYQMSGADDKARKEAARLRKQEQRDRDRAEGKRP